MGDFVVERSTTVLAAPSAVHRLVDDFHEWRRWSPWEDVDPDLQRTYTGPEKGVGAHYAWKGNRKAGEGSMEITGSTPERVDVDLEFLKPFSARNAVVLAMEPTADGGTRVTWRMTGRTKGLMGLMGKVVPMDKLVGKDFERGLAQLKRAAETAG